MEKKVFLIVVLCLCLCVSNVSANPLDDFINLFNSHSLSKEKSQSIKLILNDQPIDSDNISLSITGNNYQNGQIDSIEFNSVTNTLYIDYTNNDMTNVKPILIIGAINDDSSFALKKYLVDTVGEWHEIIPNFIVSNPESFTAYEVDG
jgi:hypothetical protein